MELKNLCVSTTPEQMWQELQKEKKLRNEGFDLNNLPESNVSKHTPRTLVLNPKSSVYEKILAQGIYLSEDELLRALKHPRAGIILNKHLVLCDRLNYTNGFYENVQRKLLSSVWGREFLYEHIKRSRYYWGSLSSDTIFLLKERQMDILLEDHPQETLSHLCANGWVLFEGTQLELVDFPFAPEILLLHLKNTSECLSDDVLLKICRKSYANSFLVEYAKFGYDIGYKVQEKIGKLPCAKEFFTVYAKTEADVNMDIYYNLC